MVDRTWYPTSEVYITRTEIEGIYLISTLFTCVQKNQRTASIPSLGRLVTDFEVSLIYHRMVTIVVSKFASDRR